MLQCGLLGKVQSLKRATLDMTNYNEAVAVLRARQPRRGFGRLGYFRRLLLLFLLCSFCISSCLWAQFSTATILPAYRGP
jgi:hypothetical protein